MQRLNVCICRGGFHYCTDPQDRFLPAPLTSAANSDSHNVAIALSPGPQAFRRLQYGGRSRPTPKSLKLLQNGVMLATRR